MTTSRFLALVVTALTAFTAVQKGYPLASSLLPLLIPLALIWFAEVLGSATGMIGHGRVNAPTPPAMVAGFGWVVLLFLVVSTFRSAPLRSFHSAPGPVVPAYVARPSPFASATEAQREAVRRYPSLSVAGSDLNLKFAARYRLYKQEHPEFFRDPSWPLTLAEELVRESR